MTLGVGMNLDLDLARVARVLQGMRLGASHAELRDRLGYHNSMVASIKSWSRHMGLVEAGSLSTLGEQLLAYDPTFERPATRLILYYRLGRNPEAEAWDYLINRFLYDVAASRRTFSTAELRDSAARAGIGAKSAAVKQRDREMALMLRTLYRPQAFGTLGILVSNADRRFTAQPPVLPPAFVAYAVFDEWPAGASHTTFSELEQPRRFARICLLTRPALVSVLRSAERAGYLRVEEEASFNRVSRAPGWDTATLLEALYVDA